MSADRTGSNVSLSAPVLLKKIQFRLKIKRQTGSFNIIYEISGKITLVDKIDELLISALSQNSKYETVEICDFLRSAGYRISEEEVESRISVLEDDGVIKGYTILVDSKKIPKRVVRVDLVRFRTSQALPKRLEGLRKYLKDAPFVMYSGRTRGGYDWITIKSFLSEEMADEENDIYRNLFGDIIQTYEVYDFNPMTDVSIYSLSYTESEFQQFVKEWMPPFFGK